MLFFIFYTIILVVVAAPVEEKKDSAPAAAASAPAVSFCVNVKVYLFLPHLINFGQCYQILQGYCCSYVYKFRLPPRPLQPSPQTATLSQLF